MSRDCYRSLGDFKRQIEEWQTWFSLVDEMSITLGGGKIITNMIPNNGESNGKEMENEMETGIME